jgi:phosphatidylglycerol lysyltransferase
MNQQKSATLSPGEKVSGKIALLFRNSSGIIFRFTLTGLFIGLAVWFFNHERTELRSVGHVLFSANPAWIMAGLGLLLLYISFQGYMYVTSFASVNAKLNFRDAIILFLKRNFISVFIPAGGISSLAFFSSSVEKKGISRSQVYFASSIYAFVGILSVIIVAIPAFIFAVSGNSTKNTRWLSLIGAILILVFIYFIYK